MTHPHAIVWLDHREATVVSFSVDSSRATELHSHTPRKLHQRSGVFGSGHAADDHQYFDEIAQTLHGVPEVLLCGPGNAKTALNTYLHERHVDVAKHIVGIETLDHPTEPELLAYARQYFRAVDQLGVAGNPV